jgi:hypothetical protein
MTKNFARTFVIGAAVAVSAITSTSIASAEEVIRAVYHINLTDAASGTTLTTSRLSIRSWPKLDQCETQKSSGGAFHVKAVEGYGIKNSAGKPLSVTLKSVECID